MNRLSRKILVLAVLLFSPCSVLATTRTVTNLNDSGAGSLRQAILDSAAGDTINFAVTGTIALTSGELQINHNLIIAGPGAANLTITRSSSSLFRIFYFDNGTWNVSGLTISNGHDTAAGGGIYNGNGNLTVSDCTITSNYALNFGGGIYTSPDTSLTVNNCTFTGNTSKFDGAISSIGNLTVTNCTFNNNGVANGMAVGGAIRCANGPVTVTNCTFSNNTVTKGGAIYSIGDLTVQSCTFSGNTATDRGNSIVITGSAVLYLGNTILQCSGANLFVDNDGSSASSMGYNLSSDDGSGFLTGPADQINTNALLDPYGLQDNGGPTRTIALTQYSPAIDQGKAPPGSVTDQRGQPRTIDNPDVFPAVGGDGTDIGAYESPADPVQWAATLVVTTTNDLDDGVCGVRDCTLREAIQRANARPVTNNIVFAPNVTGTIPLQTGLGELVISDSTNVNGPGARILTVSGNEAHRVFNFDAGTSTVSGLTIRDGWNAGSSGGVTRMGGGIYNQATLTLSDCMLTNNFVQGGNNNDGLGGAGGSAYGGGVYNIGNLTLDRCAFYRDNSGNVAGGGQGSNANQIGRNGGAGGEGAGGAVYNASGATLAVKNSTFNGNSCGGGHGGSSSFNTGGNGGQGLGGAICNLGTMVVSATTIDGNFGTGAFGGTGSHGANGANGIGIGGAASVTGSSSTIKNTISAENGGSNGGGSDAEGSFISNGYNLIGIGDFSTGFNASGDQVGTTAAPINPHLGPLQNNGGGTNTMAPQAGSSALDKGFSFGLTNDQRGRSRPYDDPTITNAPGGDGSDIGAVEIGSGPAPTSVVSRKIHGPVAFDVLLGPNTLGDECRSGGAGGNYTLILTFAAPVTFTTANVCVGTGAISSVSTSGAQVTINLGGVTPAEVLEVCLSNVNDGTTSGNVSYPFRVLVGDTTGNGSVNASDVSQTKQKSGQAVDVTNFRTDVTVNNSINASDVSLVKSRSGTALPPQQATNL